MNGVRQRPVRLLGCVASPGAIDDVSDEGVCAINHDGVGECRRRCRGMEQCATDSFCVLAGESGAGYCERDCRRKAVQDRVFVMRVQVIVVVHVFPVRILVEWANHVSPDAVLGEMVRVFQTIIATLTPVSIGVAFGARGSLSKRR